MALAHPATAARTNRFLSMTVSGASAAWQPRSFRHGGGLFWPSSLHVNMYDDAGSGTRNMTFSVHNFGKTGYKFETRTGQHQLRLADSQGVIMYSSGSAACLLQNGRGAPREPAASLASPSRSTSPIILRAPPPPRRGPPSSAHFSKQKMKTRGYMNESRRSSSATSQPIIMLEVCEKGKKETKN